MTTSEKVILVDDLDNVIGAEEKIKAHEKGLLHRAFSVFIFYQKDNKEPELLLQQRQFDKYHCAGLWANTCCSHPRPNEDTVKAGERRLFEEMGINVKLEKIGGFHYTVKFDNGLTENELDHVLVGFTDDKTVPFNKNEVNAIRWITIPELLQDLIDHPKKYAPWFTAALEVALK
jgi:isopentenyl-diphosphate delta-isomerase type 1